MPFWLFAGPSRVSFVTGVRQWSAVCAVAGLIALAIVLPALADEDAGRLTAQVTISSPASTAASSEISVLAADAASIDELRAEAQRLIDSGQAAQALDMLAAHEALHVGNPEFDYLLGVAALSAGDYAAAVHALERAVLVQPNFAGAWLDLAIAHYRLGELETADALLRHVEDNFDPSPAMRVDISAVREKFTVARVTRIVRGWQSEVGLHVGRTNNANYGLSVTSLQLTLDGLPATLLLDPGYRPRSDHFSELRANFSRTFQHSATARSDVYGLLRHRKYDNEGDLDQTDALIGGVWRTPLNLSGYSNATRYFGATLRHLSFDERGMTIGTLSTGLRVPHGQCTAIGRVDYEHRIFTGTDELDAAIPWLGAGAECSRGEWQYGGQQRIGWDRALGKRPGGDMLRAETIVYGRWQATPSLQFGGSVVYAYSRDRQAYSPILEDGARRHVHRFAQKLEALWVPGANPKSPWAIVIEIENIADRSNIGLSSVSVTQVSVGLSYRNF